MKFEKLSLYVGAALIIFLIVTANIIVWGMMENKLLADIEKRQCPVTVKTIINNYTTITQVNGTTQTASKPTVNIPPATTPSPPVNSGVNTRAS